MSHHPTTRSSGRLHEDLGIVPDVAPRSEARDREPYQAPAPEGVPVIKVMWVTFTMDSRWRNINRGKTCGMTGNKFAKTQDETSLEVRWFQHKTYRYFD